METYVEIELSNGFSVTIRDSGGLATYRYDIYENGSIISAIGMDSIIEDKVILEILVRKHLDSGGRF